MLVALAGGVGAARFLRGLLRVHDPGGVVVVGNTGDDLRMHGLADAFVLDTVDAAQAGDVSGLGLEPVVVPTLMRTVEDAAALAKAEIGRAHV